MASARVRDSFRCSQTRFSAPMLRCQAGRQPVPVREPAPEGPRSSSGTGLLTLGSWHFRPERSLPWGCPWGTRVSSSIPGSAAVPPSRASEERLHTLPAVPRGQAPRPPLEEVRSRVSACPRKLQEIFSACCSLAFYFLPSPLVVELCEHSYFVSSQT